MMNHLLNEEQFPTGFLPAWFEARHRRALEQADQLPEPSRRMESWRFGAPGNESLENFEAALPLAPEALASIIREHASMPDAIRIVYANGLPVSIPEELPEGLSVLDLEDFVLQCPDAARKYLETTPETLGSEKLAALNTALQHNGLVIMADREISRPLEIFHFISGDKVAVFPSTLVIAETGSRLHILERHVSADHGSQFCGALQQHHLSSASSVKYALVQELNSRSRAVELCHIIADDAAEMEHLVSHPGAAWARQETVCLLTGDSASVRLLSANHLKEKKELDQRTYQKHLYRGASSNLLYANVLDDEAGSIFSGMILVADGAHDTSAYQSNRNLILSPRAEANSLPGLEILADRVQCSHGSATSSISPEEIFYLLSRGIPEQTARRMIAQGFLKHALDQFSDEALRTAVEGIILS